MCGYAPRGHLFSVQKKNCRSRRHTLTVRLCVCPCVSVCVSHPHTRIHTRTPQPFSVFLLLLTLLFSLSLSPSLVLSRLCTYYSPARHSTQVEFPAARAKPCGHSSALDSPTKRQRERQSERDSDRIVKSAHSPIPLSLSLSLSLSPLSLLTLTTHTHTEREREMNYLKRADDESGVGLLSSNELKEEREREVSVKGQQRKGQSGVSRGSVGGQSDRFPSLSLLVDRWTNECGCPLGKRRRTRAVEQRVERWRRRVGG